MSFQQGQHVKAHFPDATVKAVILQIKGNEALVQESGTQRAEWIPLSMLSKL